MDPLSTCYKILKKIMSDNADQFPGEKTIFDYIHITHGQKIRICIIDNALPQHVVADIGKYYEVVQDDRYTSMPYANYRLQ